MKHLRRAAVFLRLVDEHDGNLSLTNLALIIVVGKLLFVQDAGLVDIGALLLALVNYGYKKHLSAGFADRESESESQNSDLDQRLEEMKTKINALMIKTGISVRK